ncbi:carboxymuconolactone decarboxylase family protein [Streptomyces sp. NPDC002076]
MESPVSWLWPALSGALSEGVIPVPVRERLAIATGQYNNCEYCASAHTSIGRTSPRSTPRN